MQAFTTQTVLCLRLQASARVLMHAVYVFTLVHAHMCTYMRARQPVG